jgi:thiamine biosynthesis lipoprotein
MPEASRRRFLTGGVALDALREQGERVADALAGESRLPFAGDSVRLETHGMACPWAVVLDPGPADRTLIASDALTEVDRVERLLSVFRADSPVSQLNAAPAGEPQAAPRELLELLLTCRDLNAATSAAFDPATHALIQAWRDCRNAGRIPSPFEIEAALQSCGIAQLKLRRGDADQPDTITKAAAPLGLNFGAIGKGYAIDCIAAKLRDGGITDGLVHGGHSSVWAAGEHYGQAGWPVGLKNPLFTDESYLLLLLRDQALGTSGSNIQFFRHGGRRYGHILDPRTGWPAEQLLSVSVIAPTAAQADALSTAFYVLGLEKAVEYCHTHPQVGAILTPPVEHGRTLAPVVCNVPEEQLFRVSDAVELRRV